MLNFWLAPKVPYNEHSCQVWFNLAIWQSDFREQDWNVKCLQTMDTKSFRSGELKLQDSILKYVFLLWPSWIFLDEYSSHINNFCLQFSVKLCHTDFHLKIKTDAHLMKEKAIIWPIMLGLDILSHLVSKKQRLLHPPLHNVLRKKAQQCHYNKYFSF